MHSQLNQNKNITPREFILLALLFGAVGGVAWAIRGSSGWGGIDGTIVPGMAWGVLWYWACRYHGVDARGVALWLGMGIAIGGEWGYGQYTGWILGNFSVGDQVIDIAPAIGYLWFILVGIAWGAPGGIALGWSLGPKSSLHRWLVRIVIPMGVALLCRMLIQLQPGWFFPNYSLGIYPQMPGGDPISVSVYHIQTHMFFAWCLGLLLIIVSWLLNKNTNRPRMIRQGMALLSTVYTTGLLVWMGLWLFFPHDALGLFDGELGRHLSRTVYTNSQNAIVVAWWLGAMLVAVFQRDKPTLVMGSIIGGGFGLGMVISAIWCLGYGFAPQYIDWWKLWEIHAGFNLGVLYVIALFWALRNAKVHQGTNSTLEMISRSVSTTTKLEAWLRPLASALGILLVWAYLLYEDGLMISLLLGPIFLVSVLWVSWQRDRAGAEPDAIMDRQQSLSLLFCAFFLMFILLYGATYRLGVLLELYDDKTVDQYAWVAARMWMFIPIGIVLVGGTLFKVWQMARQKLFSEIELDRLNLAIGDLIMIIGFVGMVSIWPLKISVVYAVFLFIAIFAFLRFARMYQART